MIRRTIPSDSPALVKLARDTKVFKPLEIQALREVLDDYHETNADCGHVCVTHLSDAINGFAYFAPEDMTDNTWYLYWIAVAKKTHGQGIGSDLLHFAEKAITREKGRLLLIETSSLPHYEPTRRFYLKHGYEIASVVRDYYTDGDDMILFGKRLKRRRRVPSRS